MVSAASVFGTTLLIQGAEALLAERAVAKQLRRARAEQPGAEFTEVSAPELADGRFVELTGGSLFASHSIVLVTDLANLPEEALPLVKQTALNPHPELCLVLVHGGGVKGRGLLDALKKAKIPVISAEPVKSWELPKFVAAEARSLKMTMDAGAGEALVDAVGSDLRSLTAALRQLAADHEGQTVTAEIARRYFSGRAEVTSFAVVADVLAGRAGRALERLRWALGTGTAPPLITGSLAGSLRGLGKYLELRRAGLPDSELARQVGVPPWKLRELGQQARGWNSAGVSAAIRSVARADQKVKGAVVDPAFALEQLLLDILAARRLTTS